MQEAIQEAYKALGSTKYLFGAIVVRDGDIIGRGYNQQKPYGLTAHAEMLAIREAAQYLVHGA